MTYYKPLGADYQGVIFGHFAVPCYIELSVGNEAFPQPMTDCFLLKLYAIFALQLALYYALSKYCAKLNLFFDP